MSIIPVFCDEVFWNSIVQGKGEEYCLVGIGCGSNWQRESYLPMYLGIWVNSLKDRWSKKREQGNPFLEEWGLGGVRSCRYRLWVWLTKRNLFAAIKAGHSRQQPPPLYQTICLDLFRCTVLYSLYICNGEQCIHIMAQIWMQITVCLHCTDDSHTIHTQAVGTQHCPGKFIG